MTNPYLTQAQFVDFIVEAGQAVVSTVDPQGRPEAALVELAVTPAGDLLFNTKTATRKVVNLSHNPHVAVVVGWPSITLQIEGEAVRLEGADLDAAASVFSARFPKKSLDWSAFSLYRVRPEWLRYCALQPGSPSIIAEGLPA